MNIFELEAKIALDTSEYTDGIDSSKESMENLGKSSESVLSSIIKHFTSASEPIEEMSEEALTASNKVSVLQAEFDKAAHKVEMLTDEFNKSMEEEGAYSEKTQELAQKLADAEKEEADLTKKLDDAKKGLNEASTEESKYSEETEKATKETSTFGEVLKASLAADVIKQGFSALVSGAQTAVNAIVGLTKQSLEGYAEFEQLQGGVSKLYGTAGQSLEEYAAANGQTIDEAKAKYSELQEAEDLVMSNASQAWKTAGMSANEYMETATQFSASLVSSLGGDTVKAAEQTDVAMRAISDNVNTFGSNMEDVTNAFKGFSKQNYTMLDNLKLGYGGTKAEMERLIDDANEYAASIGQASDLSIDSFSDVVTAIELVQESQNIAGTTSREAAGTIEGSIASTKAAWENLVAGFGNKDADIGALMSDVMESAMNVVSNAVPIVEQALESISEALAVGIPELAEQIPPLLEELLPSFITAVGTLVANVFGALPEIISSAMSVLDSVWQTLFSTVGTAGAQMIASFTSGISSHIASVSSTGASIISTLFSTLSANAPTMLQSATEIISTLVTGLIQMLPTLIENIGVMFTSALDFVLSMLPEVLQMGVTLILSLIDGIVESLPDIIISIQDVVTSILTTFLEHLPEILEMGLTLMGELIAGLIKAIPKIVESIPKIITNMVDTFEKFDWKSVGQNIIEGIKNGIIAFGSSLITSILDLAGNAFDAVKNFFGIHSPSRLMRDEIGRYIAEGMAVGIDLNGNKVVDTMHNLATKVNEAATLGTSMIQSFSGESGLLTAGTGDINQTVNIYAPEELSASEVARQTRKANRELILALRGV